MSDFHDISLPFAISLGAVGGPQRRTDITRLASGREQRNTPWADSQRRWDIGLAVQTLDDIAALIDFFEARRGRLHTFRFRDPLDYQSCRPSQTPSALDQPVGTGDGSTTRFRLTKRYASGRESWTRVITRPVAGSVLVALDGSPVSPQVDTLTGEIDFASPPAAGQAITAGFRFDCAVRFDTDQLDIALDHVRAGQVPSIPLVEVRS
ncbi:DUF2460 domain-containing protein [Maricaulis sp.]|uniref:DUF2460 domain-containing protein n=1 Tax=unclassified Maricaulis TaxID=2632371 RepID=UPI001B035A00|nr:DUF2460 domain-containing protein [Maricaulis sp.]MBO6797135.1 DUF2460 domain-containing protein [Maricaulis sp.]